jgi:hypothetical protein
VVAVSRRGTGSPTPGHAVRQHDRSASAGPAQRRARVAQHGGGYAQTLAHRHWCVCAVERGDVVIEADGLVVPHEHTGNAPTAGAAHQPLARYLVLRADESTAGTRATWFISTNSPACAAPAHTAITERKSNNPVVWGQGRAQLETRSHDAEAPCHSPRRKSSSDERPRAGNGSPTASATGKSSVSASRSDAGANRVTAWNATSRPGDGQRSRRV